MRQRINLQGVAFQYGQPAGIGIGNLGQRRQAAAVFLDGQYMAGPFGQQPARQPARTRPNLQHITGGHVTGLARDLGGQVQIQQEILAQRFARAQVMVGDHLPQRGKGVDGAHASVPARVIRCAMRSASIMLVGLAMPLPAMSKAVP